MNTELDNLHDAEGENKNENIQNEKQVENKVSENSDHDAENHKSHQEEEEQDQNHIPDVDFESLDLSQIHQEIQKFMQDFSPIKINSIVKSVAKVVRGKISEDKEAKQKEFEATLNSEDESEDKTFVYQSIWQDKFKQLFYNHKKNLDLFFKEKDEQQKKNLEVRKQIIEDLKELYQNPATSNQQIFQKFREIKTAWHNSGMVPRADADNIYKTYFHHLDNFYDYLNLNKELQEMDHAHNLEQRKNIIERSKELLQEENLFKALNELQYLHKMWKEEAVPVAEEHREPTWQEFKEITNQIHDRKNEWFEELRKQEEQNLVKKNEVLRLLSEVTKEQENLVHRDWQNKIKQVEKLRTQFLDLGKVPKENTNETWTSFKTILRDFNHAKNEFYKNLKHQQHENLKKKEELIKIAEENKDSENWKEALDLFKKIQNDWKKVGHIPRKLSDKKWNEFKEACNHFFDRFKDRNEGDNEEFKKNLTLKNTILEDLEILKEETNKDKVLDEIKKLHQQWSQVGKVPRANMNVNRMFDKLAKEITSKLDISESEKTQFNVEMQLESIITNQDERGLDDEIRKLKKQIQDLEQEIAVLDNNLSFFGNADKNNPLVKDSYDKLDAKKASLSKLRDKYSTMIRIDFSDNQ
ncbi:MAG: DUF349 domain-containing protein [Flavobacteriales bacterium]|nr:DUF349 domain-containing protein [Flavobacteriales bacterium]